MELPIYQVDAFSDHVFRGNPAAVVPLARWLPDHVLLAIAAENNLAETAFYLTGAAPVPIRWFTPTVEVELCGHATLATAFVILQLLEPALEQVRFRTQKGLELRTWRDGERLVLDFPAHPPRAIEIDRDVVDAIGAEPTEMLETHGTKMLVYPREADVAGLRPDFRRLGDLKTYAVCTAPGEAADFVSRFFAPPAGIDEDPVTGSAHCLLTPYWAHRLGKTTLEARQISPRTGELRCELRDNRVFIAGKAVLYLRGTIEIPAPSAS